MLNNILSIYKFKANTSPRTITNPNANKKLKVYYYNDTHGNSDEMAGVVQSAKLFKQKQNLDKDTVSFVLSAGDNVSGGNREKNSFIFNLMQNIMNVDVSAVGNHELDSTAQGFFEATDGKNLSFVATNVELDDNNPLNKFVKKSIIKEQNGQKYGFIGAMPQDFELCTKKDAQKGLKVQDFDTTVKSLQDEINNLKKQGINKIILVSHSGYDMDKRLASALDGLDIIIGGHSHSVVEGTNSENIVMSKTNEPVIITQAGENGKYYGILEAEFDSNGVIKKVANQLFESTNRTKSPIIEYVKKEQMGESPEIAKVLEIDPMPQNRRLDPCAWTDMLADSMQEEMNVELAIVNSANTRKVPKEGVLTKRDVEESSPMKNKLIKTRVTQKQVVDALKASLKASFADEEGAPGILHFSSMRYKADKKGNLLELSYIDKQGKVIPIDINNPSQDITYSACYDDFVAKADGEYPDLAPQFEVEKFDYDKDETMCNYISKLPQKDNLVVKDDKRIEII